MTEIEKIFLTSSITIIGGVIIFTMQQIISKFFVETIYRQSEIISDISDALVYYAREYSSPGLLSKELQDQAHNKFRQLASLLKARSYMIKWYGFLSFFSIIPNLNNIEEASSNLIGLSNSLFNKSDGVENHNRVVKIKKLLGIPSGIT
ncbi:MAG: hypothetical protein UR68_C0014G0008 [Candidatus Roizmanbacteria bacterium GW2011_GWA2_35_19]|uniref:Uncharacterized protein n=2 Tax=Candidatus Roizmaniibacteriota TaxID=1752723 RepID=A0A0G0BT72_9BACT|nr:MAG: hypothetical protein UR63_C0022G0008 [Candidatus Roizmanbacteria bacterium GW2011_GWC2_35_12]KKP72538.1 MAG: hypothetical protein UR68_C0014G0008 [Candidatus Roizmanbacteria bacterium GW2011_GWA2_35_19]